MNSLSCFISVGEVSGDLIAADLVKEFKHRCDCEFFGITGDSLKNQGVLTIGDILELSAMGFWEVFQNLGAYAKFANKILAEIDRRKPKIAILVDYPGFHFFLAEQLKLREIIVIQYVSPKVWAWGRGRIKKLEEFFDLVLGIFPFEVEFFEKTKVNFAYIGNPVKERVLGLLEATKQNTNNNDKKIISFLPGSRSSEIQYMMPSMVELCEVLSEKLSNYNFVFLLAPNVERQNLEKYFHNHQELLQRSFFIKGDTITYMKKSRVCVVTSGTATLECGLCLTPMMVMYRMHWLTYKIAKKKIGVSMISLVNLILGQMCVKEYIQDLNVASMSEEIEKLAQDGDYRQNMILKLQKMTDLLGSNAAGAACERILKLL